jgi:subtilase family serine protease
VRYKLAFFPTLLALLLVGSFFLPRSFLPTAKAHGLFDSADVGGVSPFVKISRVTGHASLGDTLQMSIGLALRRQNQLTQLLNDLYDSSSPSYHQFLSVEQFTEQFGPSEYQQQAMIHYLIQQGFTITHTYPNRLLIDFSGPQSLAEQVFGVTIDTYEGPAGQEFFANDRPPTLPAYIAPYVTTITGLDDANNLYHPPIVSPHAPTLDPNAGNCPTAGQSGGGGGGILGGSQVAYIPSQFAKAYNYDGLHNAGLSGQGQTVGVFELDGYAANDIQAYTRCFGGGNVPIQNVTLDGFNGQPGAGAIEVELDMEAILSMAPRLAKLIVYEAPNTTQGYNDEWARIVSDRTPVVSVSWGDCETNTAQQEAQQENTFFQEAAAQGQTILVAAGDSGSETCWQQNYDPSLIADDPAAQPYVTGVGGTTLTLNSDNSRASESVWNDGFFGGAGGGGLSQYWKQPSWQTGPGTNGSYANGMRQTPDVSLDADPATGYPIYCTAGANCNGSSGLGGGGWLTVGGTSAAAPMWAAMIALANEQAAKVGKGHMGFLNPALYEIGGGSHYQKDIYDVTPPDNSNTPSNNDELGFNGGAYPVTNGYDMATGWGTFDAVNFAADLVAMAK